MKGLLLTTKFKVGDKIICKNNLGYEKFLTVGKKYKVLELDTLNCLKFTIDNSDKIGWAVSTRFILVKELKLETDYLDAFQQNFKGDEYDNN